MLLPCLLKILENIDCEGWVYVRERESKRARGRKTCLVKKKDERWNITCPLLVSSDSSWNSSTQRLEGILTDRCFICVCYMCHCNTWISVLCILLTPREADVVKFHSGKHNCSSIYCCHCCFHILCLLTEACSYHRQIVWERVDGNFATVQRQYHKN